MALSVKMFRVIDSTIAARIYRSAEPIIKRWIAEVLDEFSRRNLGNLDKVITSLDLTSVIEENRSFINKISVAALLFGASQASDTRNSRMMNSRKPALLNKATLLFDLSVHEMERKLENAARSMIIKELKRQKEEEDKNISKQQIEKADIVRDFVSFFEGGVKQAGLSALQVISSLHTSRLSVYGFTLEAGLSNIEYYEVSEVLDSRTCPVCEFMDGKVFPVDVAQHKIEGLIGEDDPVKLKSLDRWFPQNKSSIERLDMMDYNDLLANNLQTPPYHPLCRGVLLPTDKELSLEDRGLYPTGGVTSNEVYNRNIDAAEVIDLAGGEIQAVSEDLEALAGTGLFGVLGNELLTGSAEARRLAASRLASGEPGTFESLVRAGLIGAAGVTGLALLSKPKAPAEAPDGTLLDSALDSELKDLD